MKLSQVLFQVVTESFRNAEHCSTDLVSWRRLCRGKDAREWRGKTGKCACLFNKEKGEREIRHMQKNPVTVSADDLWGWKYFDNSSEGTKKESL